MKWRQFVACVVRCEAVKLSSSYSLSAKRSPHLSTCLPGCKAPACLLLGCLASALLKTISSRTLISLVSLVLSTDKKCSKNQEFYCSKRKIKWKWMSNPRNHPFTWNIKLDLLSQYACCHMGLGVNTGSMSRIILDENACRLEINSASVHHSGSNCPLHSPEIRAIPKEGLLWFVHEAGSFKNQYYGHFWHIWINSA